VVFRAQERAKRCTIIDCIGNGSVNKFEGVSARLCSYNFILPGEGKTKKNNMQKIDKFYTY